MKNLTSEQIREAKAAKSAEELLELAKANNIDMTEEAAKTYFEQLNANGAVCDEELDAIVVGGCGDSDEDSTETKEKPIKHPCPVCKGPTVANAFAKRTCIICGHVFYGDLDIS